MVKVSSCLLLLLVASCKGHIQDRQVSDPDFVVSNDGTMLTFAPAKIGIDHWLPGWCALQTHENNPDTSVLITTEGSINNYQLMASLRYMGIPEHLITSSVATITAFFTLFHANRRGIARDKAILMALGIVGVFHTGKVAYRVIRGKQEGESGGAQAVSALGTGVITGPIIELFIREKRANQALSSERVLRLSDKKMKKVVQRISDMRAERFGACDYLKTS